MSPLGMQELVYYLAGRFDRTILLTKLTFSEDSVKGKRMIEPIIENIEQVLAGLADGTLDRQEAVAWGEAVYQRL